MKLAAIPLLLFFMLGLIFYKGLSLDPQKLPSAKIGQALPGFQLPALGEQTPFSSHAIRGHYTLLNIWASWCSACQAEQSFLLQLADEGVHLVGLNYKDTTKDAEAWLRIWGNPYEHVLEDREGKVAIELGVYGAPETFLISPDGIIRYRHVGVLTKNDWEKYFLPRLK